MKTVILDVRDPEEAMQDFVDVWKTGKAKEEARISFATPELLWKVLTAKRWELLKALCGAGPVTVREAAKRVNRDIKAVHSDLHRAAQGRSDRSYRVGTGRVPIRNRQS